jgi:NAD(P)H-hydrate epimerase
MEIIRLTRSQLRQADQIAIGFYGIPGILLMENAARNLSKIVHEACNACPSRIVIVCGSGNNAGDGYAAARHLSNLGHSIRIVVLKPIDQLQGDARLMADIANKMWLEMVHDPDAISSDCDVIIDAIFGTGLSRTPEGTFAKVIEQINRIDAKVHRVAVDIPSGLDCDTGIPMGVAVKAHQTVTFLAEKVGFSRPEASIYTGKITVVDIGAPVEVIQKVQTAFHSLPT